MTHWTMPVWSRRSTKARCSPCSRRRATHPQTVTVWPTSAGRRTPQRCVRRAVGWFSVWFGSVWFGSVVMVGGCRALSLVGSGRGGDQGVVRIRALLWGASGLRSQVSGAAAGAIGQRQPGPTPPGRLSNSSTMAERGTLRWPASASAGAAGRPCRPPPSWGPTTRATRAPERSADLIWDFMERPPKARSARRPARRSLAVMDTADSPPAVSMTLRVQRIGRQSRVEREDALGVARQQHPLHADPEPDTGRGVAARQLRPGRRSGRRRRRRSAPRPGPPRRTRTWCTCSSRSPAPGDGRSRRATSSRSSPTRTPREVLPGTGRASGRGGGARRRWRPRHSSDLQSSTRSGFSRWRSRCAGHNWSARSARYALKSAMYPAGTRCPPWSATSRSPGATRGPAKKSWARETTSTSRSASAGPRASTPSWWCWR